MSRMAVLCSFMAMFALVLVLELMAPGPGDNDPPPPNPGALTPPAAAETGTLARSGPTSDALAGDAASIIERPLFSPTRRPGDRPANPVTEGVSKEGLPRLTGVIFGPSGGRAIFAGADGKSRIAGEGDSIGAFKVRSIAPGLITLSGSEGDRVLRPSYVASPGEARSGDRPAGNPPLENSTSGDATPGTVGRWSAVPAQLQTTSASGTGGRPGGFQRNTR